MWPSEFLLLLLSLPVSVLSVCLQSRSFPSSVLPPAVVSRVGSVVRVDSAHSLPRCVEAACAISRADLAWFFQGRCFVVSCQQRALCRPQTRPGSQSQLVFIQRGLDPSHGLFWGEYKSSEAPGDLQALKDLGLLRSQLDYDDPDLDELDFPLSKEEMDLTDQSELMEREGLNQSEAVNETTPTAARQRAEPTQRPLQAETLSSDPEILHSDSDPTRDTTSLPVPSMVTSLPAVVDRKSSSSVSALPVESSPSSSSGSSSGSSHSPAPSHSLPTESARAAAVPSPSTPIQTGLNQSTPVLSAPVQLERGPRATSAPCSAPAVTSSPSGAVGGASVSSGAVGGASVSLGAVGGASVSSGAVGGVSVSSGAVGAALVAHAGGSYSLTLPNSSIVLQGSVTNADPGSVTFYWTRDAQSPAAGEVLFGSQSASSLVLVDLVQGSYLFHLRVTDAHGRSASASATVQVLPEPGGAEEVELEMQVSVSQVSVSQRDTVVAQLSALLRVPPSDIQQRGLYGHAPLSTVFRFSVRSPSGSLPGSSVVSVLKNHLLRDRTEYLLFRVLRVDTVVCQLQCSGRGQCDPVTRLCLCDPFWTENLLRTYIGDGQSNCEWRVLYVILSGFILVILILTAAWTFMCCCRRKRQTKVRRKTRYTILDNVDEQERVELRPKFSLKHRSTEHNSSLMMSESELSDQDFREAPLRSRNRTKLGLNQV